ncbi:MAG TPA: methylated-DNA--[protein]-cysteine S-methyltransferase [Planctomycetota bacterium]|nr:methylated-DNA--[protein]-cysteine S-methyltransferase [Planctomycetota bacterium]
MELATLPARLPRVKSVPPSILTQDYLVSQFTLSEAPAAFQSIRWEAEFSPRGLRRLTLLSGVSGEKFDFNGDTRSLGASEDRRVKALKRMLLDRLKGGRSDFAWEEFDLADAGPFHRRVWQAMRKIPFGETATYAEIARDAGSPMAFRACGQACGANRIILFIPCHRVVSSSGLGGFGCGLEWKRKFLAMESMGSNR